MNDNTSAAYALSAETADNERANRTLHKLVKLAHAMSEEERELALVMLQAISAWNGMAKTA